MYRIVPVNVSDFDQTSICLAHFMTPFPPAQFFRATDRHTDEQTDR